MISVMMAHIKIYVAGKTGIGVGRKEDVFGRTYRYVYKQFGHEAMFNEYVFGANSWLIR